MLNDTCVMPALTFFNKESGGRVEILFVRPMTARPGGWQAMVRAHRPLKEGTRLLLDDGHAISQQGHSASGSCDRSEREFLCRSIISSASTGNSRSHALHQPRGESRRCRGLSDCLCLA